MKLLSVVSCVLLLLFIVFVNAAQTKQTAAVKNVHGQSQDHQSHIRRRDLSFFPTQSFYPTLSIHHRSIPLNNFPPAADASLPMDHPATLVSGSLGPSFNALITNDLNDPIKRLEANLISLKELQKQAETDLAELKSGQFATPAPLHQSNLPQPPVGQKLNAEGGVHSPYSFTADKFDITSPSFWKELPAFTNPNVLLDPVFGPEIAPKYEIHYVPENFKFDDFPPLPYFGLGLGPVLPLRPTFSDPSFGVDASIPPFPPTSVKPELEPTATSATNINQSGNKSGNGIEGENFGNAIGSENVGNGIGGENSGNAIGSENAGNAIGSENAGNGIGGENSGTENENVTENFDPNISETTPDLRIGTEGEHLPTGSGNLTGNRLKTENFAENSVGGSKSIDGPNPNISRKTVESDPVPQASTSALRLPTRFIGSQDKKN